MRVPVHAQAGQTLSELGCRTAVGAFACALRVQLRCVARRRACFSRTVSARSTVAPLGMHLEGRAEAIGAAAVVQKPWTHAAIASTLPRSGRSHQPRPASSANRLLRLRPRRRRAHAERRQKRKGVIQVRTASSHSRPQADIAERPLPRFKVVCGEPPYAKRFVTAFGPR